MVSLTAQRLILRPLVEEDTDLVAHYCSDPEMHRNTALIPFPYTRDHAEAFLACVHPGDVYERGVTLGIEWRETGTFCGCIELGMNRKNDRSELGYWIGREFWGRGIATEASRRILRFGFEELALHKITSGYYDFNAASGRVQEKLGFQIEGHLRDQVKRDGTFHTLIKTGLLLSEWREKTA